MLVSTHAKKKHQVAIIGLDGMSWEILLQYLDHLPNTRRVIDESFLGVLKCVPPLTLPSWTSIFTGVKMNKHGIYGFTKYVKIGDSVQATFFNSRDVKIPRLSEILALNGYQVLVVGQPPSYPLQGWYPRNQILVYDATSPKPFIYPPKYSKYLRFFKYLNHEYVKPSEAPERILVKLIKCIASRIRGLELLLMETNIDALIIVFPETDSAMHIKPNIADKKIDTLYLKLLQYIDDFVGYVAKKFDIVLLVSDHGMQCYLKSINLAKILNNLNNIRGSALRRKMASLLNNCIVGILLYLAMRHDLSYKIYRHLRLAIRNLLKLKDTEPKIQEDNARRKVLLDQIDVHDSWILYLTDEKIVEWVIRKIREVFANTLRIVDVFRTETGMYAVHVMPQYGFFIDFDKANPKSIPWHPTTAHNPYGIFALKCSSLSDSNGYVGVVNNYDVLPTILNVLDIPLPSYIDGQAVQVGRIKKREQISIDYRPFWKLARKTYWLRYGIK